MAIQLSTCLANTLIGKPITVTDAGSQISFTAPSTVATTQSDFLTTGFRPGQVFKIASGGSTTQTTPLLTIASLVAGTITTSEATVVTEAAAVDEPTLSVPNGLNWLTIFRYGQINLYTSPMPANADLAETGTLLCSYTVSSLTVTPGTSTNGLQYEFDATGKIIPLTGQTWSGVGAATGTAYYARMYDNAVITGLDSTNLQSNRFQGRVGVSGQDFDITSTSIVTGVTSICNAINITQPLLDT